MTFITVFIVVCLLAIFAPIVVRQLSVVHGRRYHSGRISFALWAAVILWTGFNSFTMISSGHEGVVSVFGKVRDAPLDSGLRFIPPWASIDEQELRLMVFSQNLDCLSVDQQKVVISLTVNYQRLPGATPMLVDQVSEETEMLNRAVVDPAANEVTKAFVARYQIAQILESRGKIRSDIQDGLTTWMKKHHLLVREVSITNVDFSAAYDQAIEDKQEKEQRVQQAAYELEKSKTEADQVIAKAKGEADNKIEQAKGKAKRIITTANAEAAKILKNAEAEAEALAKIGANYSELLLLRDYAAAWKGNTPRLTSDGNEKPSVILQMPNERNDDLKK